MKKSRLMLNRKRKRSNLILVFLLCIVLPLLAIYIGLNVTERFVLPALNSKDSLDSIDLGLEEEDDDANIDDEVVSPVEDLEEGEEKTFVGELKPLSIYTIQIASLADKENLDNLINQLNNSKQPYIVYQVDNSFKVYTRGYTKRAYVEAGLLQVRETFSDAYISEIHLPIREVSAVDKDHSKADKIIKALNELIDNMDKQSEEWYNFFVKEGDYTNYIELLKKQQSTLEVLAENIEETFESKGLPEKIAIDKMIHYQESNIKRSIELLEGGVEVEEFRLYNLYLDSLFRIVELIK